MAITGKCSYPPYSPSKGRSKKKPTVMFTTGCSEEFCPKYPRAGPSRPRTECRHSSHEKHLSNKMKAHVDTVAPMSRTGGYTAGVFPNVGGEATQSMQRTGTRCWCLALVGTRDSAGGDERGEGDRRRRCKTVRPRPQLSRLQSQASVVMNLGRTREGELGWQAGVEAWIRDGGASTNMTPSEKLQD